MTDETTPDDEPTYEEIDAVLMEFEAEGEVALVSELITTRRKLEEAYRRLRFLGVSPSWYGETGETPTPEIGPPQLRTGFMRRKVRSDERGVYVTVDGWVLRPTPASRILNIEPGDDLQVSRQRDPVHPKFGVVAKDVDADEHSKNPPTRWKIYDSEHTNKRRYEK